MISAELIYARKATKEFCDTIVNQPWGAFSIERPIFMMAESIVHGYKMGGSVLIAIERRAYLSEQVDVWVAVDDGTYKWWGSYDNKIHFRGAWTVTHEFRRVLIEKKGFYV